MPAVEPVCDAELNPLFSIYSGHRHLALAVSGGPDSLALMHLSLAWCLLGPANGPQLTILTVDHGLRAEAAAEATAVAAAAAALGLPARILTRQAPSACSAIQASARADRYRLLFEAAQQIGATAVVTGHTIDDQAETLLMRLARGSGVDGLAAMRNVSRLNGHTLLRPLLGLSKSRLEASLIQRGVSWSRDPSNLNIAFERPRLRAALPALAAAGLSQHAIARSAQRLARARDALGAMTREAAGALLAVHDDGYVSIDRSGFDRLPTDLRLRLLSRVLARIGTPGQPERLARLEALEANLSCGARRGTLAGCLVHAMRDRMFILREAGRRGLPEVTLHPGQSLDWDRRCVISLAARSQEPVILRALRPKEISGWVAKALAASGQSSSIVLAAPAVWRGEALLALPALGLWHRELSFSPSLSLNCFTGLNVDDTSDNDIDQS